MAEYINRESVQNAMEFITKDCTCPLHIAAEIDQLIALYPADDVEKVRHGKWKVVYQNKKSYCI